jgi:hypothetical protein
MIIDFLTANASVALIGVLILLVLLMALSKMKAVTEIINHTLKNPKTGKWSRKNLTGFLSFGYSMFYCSSGMITEKPVQEFVVAFYLGTALTCFRISAWEKINIKHDSQK